MSGTSTDQAVFLIVVGSIRQRACARLLMDSIRAFGGVLSGCPIWLVEADPQISCDSLAQMGAQVIPAKVPATLQNYEFAAQVCACACAETLAVPEVRSLIYLSPEVLVIKPPLLFDLAPCFDAAVRPVHIKNVGLGADKPLDDFWKKVYATVGVADIQATVESFVDAQHIRAYFNAGAFSISPSAGVFRRWLNCFEALVCNEAFQAGACQDERHRVFLHQAVLSALLVTMLDSGRIRALPPSYGYPYNLHQAVPPERRTAALNDLTCVIYEQRTMNPDRMDDIHVHAPLRSWLSARAAQV